MASLPSLPTELIREILSHLRPIHELHRYYILEEERWDVRHWDRTLAAVARTCRTLHEVAVPLLYSHYETTDNKPLIPFIERPTVEPVQHQGLRCVIVGHDAFSNSKYTPTIKRQSQYCVWKNDPELKSYAISNSETLSSEDAAHFELWRLVSQAPNLESLSVTKYSSLGKTDRDADQPPVFLSPIVSAAHGVRTNFMYSGRYQKLHSLTLNMQDQCGTWLVELFSLPCLRSLSLIAWGRLPYDDWEVSLVWPEPAPISSIQNLSFSHVTVPADVIIRMANFCRALTSFRCWSGSEQAAGGEGRSWCIEILEGLQKHKRTLTSLNLIPDDRWAPRHLYNEYEPVPGFQTLDALQILDVPWHVLMGSPAGSWSQTETTLEITGEWQYPVMRDTLPVNLQRLKIDLSERSLPGHSGLEEGMCSALPHESWADDNVPSLKRIDVVYRDAHWHRSLPMNFWRVQDAYRKRGCAFIYNIKLDPCDFLMKAPDDDLELPLDTFGRTMAKEGPSGVHMASRFELEGMPRRVMGFLGLGREWLDTEEAKEILFDEEVDYDACCRGQRPSSEEPEKVSPAKQG